MVIELLSLIFFRVPSCAAAGTAMARAKTARIRVIDRFMSVSLWPVRVRGWMGGGRLQDSTGVPRSLSKRCATAKRLGGLEFDLLPPEGARHEPRGDAHRARSPRRPRGPRRSLLRDPHASRARAFSD